MWLAKLGHQKPLILHVVLLQWWSLETPYLYTSTENPDDTFWEMQAMWRGQRWMHRTQHWTPSAQPRDLWLRSYQWKSFQLRTQIAVQQKRYISLCHSLTLTDSMSKVITSSLILHSAVVYINNIVHSLQRIGIKEAKPFNSFSILYS